MPKDTRSTSQTMPRPVGTKIFYAALHLGIAVAIAYAAKETLPHLRRDVQVLVAGLTGIIGAGFIRTWTSHTPEDTFISALLTALLSFVAFICVNLGLEAGRFHYYGKATVYSVLALVAAIFALLSLYNLLFGGHRR